MTAINFILDLAALLLLLSWRSIRFDPLNRAVPATLVGTVRRAEPRRLRRWHWLAGLALLLLLRAAFYWQIGPAVDWTPQLDVGGVVLAFRGDVFATELLFSVASFARAGMILFTWLVTLSVIQGPTANPDPILKLIRLQLGAVAGWPRWVQSLLPAALAGGLWMAAYPALAGTEIMHRVSSVLHLLGQAGLVGLQTYLTLKHLLPAILLLHLVSSYVFLGNNPFWDFIGITARKILRPLRGIPLQYRRIDIAPLAGIVLILLLLQVFPRAVENLLDRHGLSLWPQ